MPRRLLSLDFKFPLLMSAIVVATGALFLWAAYTRFSDALTRSAAERIRTSALLVVANVAEGIPGTAAQIDSIGRIAEVRAFLAGTADPDSTLAALSQWAPIGPEAMTVRLRLLAPDGVERLELRLQDQPETSWVAELLGADTLTAGGLIVSPFMAADTLVQYELARPVFRSETDSSVTGYVVLTRLQGGDGAEAIRQFTGANVLLFGHPAQGVWTDLSGVSPGPPPGTVPDSVQTFDVEPYGAGIGLLTAIPGTPWMIWLQYARSDILAPVRQFVVQILLATLAIAALAVFITWTASRNVTRRITRLTGRIDALALPIAPTEPLLRGGRDEIDRLEDSFRHLVENTDKQKRLEAQLNQTQKLEAVGRLAGGIAHDFNNVLTVVTNYGELVRARLDPDSDTAHDVDEIIKASERAAKLTRQLLAFSGRQVLQPMPLDLNDVVEEATRMLRRVLPSQVEISRELAPSLPAVLADPGQIEQVILNLAINASDAMPDGGKLSLRTAVLELDDLADPATGAPGEARPYVSLVVRDTGVGMEPEVVRHAFEPFFTTKGPTKGTGLGLASVHGIIAQLGGRIWLYSEPGQGTTFKIYLPIVADEARPLPRSRRRRVTPTRSGTVLVVEDDPATREVTRRILVSEGLKVVEAANGQEALAALRSGKEPVHIVLSDVMMPAMTGVDLAGRIAREWPALPVLLMSGYSDVEVTGRDASEVHWELIEKPFTAHALVKAISLAWERDGRPNE